MYINVRSLLSMGVAFWGLLCATDLFGESSWKRHSEHLNDILDSYQKVVYSSRTDQDGGDNAKMDWSSFLWNTVAFVCSLVFCTMLRSMSWIVWKVFRLYNNFKSHRMSNQLDDDSNNCQILFQNQLFAQKNLTQANDSLSKEIDVLKKDKEELSQQLASVQNDNLTARQQIEEFKLETFMMKEKLTRTTNTLKENMKYKDFANANQEIIARKAHSLEVHLKEVTRDREVLRNKMNSMENAYRQIEARLKMYEKQQESETNLEQVPEKDTNNMDMSGTTCLDTEMNGSSSVDMCKFQKKIFELQRSIGHFDNRPINTNNFEANSKISVDLDDSSKENDLDTTDDAASNNKPININYDFLNQYKKIDIDIVKQNIMNYNAYKTQMLKPKLTNLKERIGHYVPSDTTGSSSEDNGVAPQRIISSTAEFQNFLKTLSSQTNCNVNLKNIF